MADETDGKERPLWQLTRNEQRLLLITFVGSLAAIVCGAAVIGLALALARYEAHVHSSWSSLLGSLAAGVVTTGIVVAYVLGGNGQAGKVLGMLFLALYWSFYVLWLIGIAAGIH